MISSAVCNATPMSTTGKVGSIDLWSVYGAMYANTYGKIASEDNGFVPSTLKSQSVERFKQVFPKNTYVGKDGYGYPNEHASMMASEFMAKSSEISNVSQRLYTFPVNRVGNKVPYNIGVLNKILAQDINVVFAPFKIEGGNVYDDMSGSIVQGKRYTLKQLYANNILPIASVGNPFHIYKSESDIQNNVPCSPNLISMYAGGLSCYDKVSSDAAAYQWDDIDVLVVQQAEKLPGGEYWYGNDTGGIYTARPRDASNNNPTIDVAVDISNDLITPNNHDDPIIISALSHPKGSSTAAAFMAAYAHNLIEYADIKGCPLDVHQLMDTINLSTKEHNGLSARTDLYGWGVYNHQAAKNYIDVHYCQAQTVSFVHECGTYAKKCESTMYGSEFDGEVKSAIQVSCANRSSGATNFTAKEYSNSYTFICTATNPADGGELQALAYICGVKKPGANSGTNADYFYKACSSNQTILN